MSSQDKMKYAESEKASAEVLKGEVASQQAKIDALQKDVSTNPELQDKLDSERGILASLQEKQKRHEDDYYRLNQEGIDEQRHEQEEELKKQEKERDSLAKKTVKESIRRGLFG